MCNSETPSFIAYYPFSSDGVVRNNKELSNTVLDNITNLVHEKHIHIYIHIHNEKERDIERRHNKGDIDNMKETRERKR